MAVSAGYESMGVSANEEAVRRLNESSREQIVDALLACCGSLKWVQRMVLARPFADVQDLLSAADRVWWELRAEDWLEAFAHHPRIGERQAARDQSPQAAQWSEAEQAASRRAADATLEALAQANRDYEGRFGYTFIVCATGKSAAEILATCRDRLGHNADEELRVAAEEQRRITHLRLQKLLGETP